MKKQFSKPTEKVWTLEQAIVEDWHLDYEIDSMSMDGIDRLLSDPSLMLHSESLKKYSAEHRLKVDRYGDIFVQPVSKFKSSFWD